MTYFVRMFVTADIHSAEHQFLPWLPGHQLRCLRLGMGFKEFHWHEPWKIWSYLRNNEVDNNPPNGWWDDLLLGFVTLMSPPLTICGTWLALPWEIPVRWTQPLCPSWDQLCPSWLTTNWVSRAWGVQDRQGWAKNCFEIISQLLGLHHSICKTNAALASIPGKHQLISIRNNSKPSQHKHHNGMPYQSHTTKSLVRSKSRRHSIQHW